MLDDLLPRVKRPIRYTGGEYNIVTKTNPRVNVAIVFPEVYEIGMSNLGIKVIYHLFNQDPDIQCERVFAPWPDFGEQLAKNNLPLYGLETGRPLREFDLVGFSLQSELSYTNVLYVLELAQIPRLNKDRDDRHPIVVAGGPATLNPNPLSPVFDAFAIGDGEEIVGRIARILKDIPRARRHNRLEELAGLPGVWVPALHDHDRVIKKNVTAALTDAALPLPAILPICEITHDRLAVEVMRGCTWGCRFCQAGYANRPLRLRPEDEVMRAAEQGIRQTGWEELSLLAFSILDYPNLTNLIRRLNEMLHKKMVSISLPAMRGELFSEELAVLLREVKKTGLTFAPEAASEGLRNRLNKSFTNEQMIGSINTAYRLGWRQVKLYFMIGLPFEGDEDIREIDRLTEQILKVYTRGNIKISVSPFVPKPHTPFEAVPFADLDELKDKIARIRKARRRRVEVRYQAPEASYIEAFLSRGDEKIFPVVEAVYQKGGRFEEWREGFDFDRWQQAFAEVGIDPATYLRPSREPYPWDFIDIGVTKGFLKEEFKQAQDSAITRNCHYHGCVDCGACEGRVLKYPEAERYVVYGRLPKRSARSILYRVKYAIGEPYRYASHLDITRTIYRGLRRSDLPILFTQGFSPIPKVSFGPPKSVGQITKGDYFDFYLGHEYFGNISQELNGRFPAGIRILDVRSISPSTPSLTSSINLIYYEVGIPAEDIVHPLDFSGQPAVYVEKKSARRNIVEDVETLVIRNGLLYCGLKIDKGGINVYDLLAYLTDTSAESVKVYPITRTSMFIKRNGIIYSPMEVK